ncbi:MAG: UDP-glucose 6-dehydrogenase AglM [Halobacteria archaeon]|nr:UDP-glucose 6-dehydrogenase AglM [Halobacteria archaeon]
MRIGIIGSGYVGTTIAACFAEWGHNVVNVDVDEDIVETINAGDAPIHEPGLDELIERHAGKNLNATTNYDEVLNTDIIFLALPTPSNEDGGIDLSVMKDGAQSLGETLAEKDGYPVVVVKSTVIPRSTEDVLLPIIEEASGMNAGEGFGMAVNPEFLREGSAVDDFLNPDKIVIGTSDEVARDRLEEVYEPIIEENRVPVVNTGLREAEMIKYANNAFLATKISLINELGNICKEYGVDAYEVAEAIGLDHRISESFLRSGVGWGGSCLPKDTNALIRAARDVGYEPTLLEAAVEVNDKQPERLLSLLDRHVDVEGKRVAVLGLAFKPGTDDIRNSRAIPVIFGLLERGAEVVAYDPVSNDKMREIFDVEYANSARDALEGSHGAIVVTDWDEFDNEFDLMSRPVVVDGRRVINRREGIVYEGLTW